MAKCDWTRLAVILPAVLIGKPSLASDLPSPLPNNVPSTDVTGFWEFIPVPLPEQNITHLGLARKKDRLFLGTREGVASYDGVTVLVPEFSPVEAQQSLIVNSMVETDDGGVIVGTTNDSLWRWKDNRLLPLYGACPRGSGCPTGDWALAKSMPGILFTVSDALKTSRLKVAVVAPQLDPSLPLLPHVKEEADAVASTARAWGAEIISVDPTVTKAEVLDALCGSHLFHYAGHAEFDPFNAGRSYLPLLNDSLTADEVAEALSSRSNNLLFAFINGCGTSRETSWERANEVYGFASAFLNNASYFIGTQRPIQDEFAAPFAAAFYKQLFTTSYDLWWRLIRGDQLSGLSFAESLRRARHTVREMSSTSDQTWLSYVFYGDPTRRLVLA